MSFHFYKQLDPMDCGPTCLRMIARAYGRHYSLAHLRNLTHFTSEGTSLLDISIAAERIGFSTLNAELSFEQLDEEAILPCILFWKQRHFVVLPPQNYNRHKQQGKIQLADPAIGIIKLDRDTFLSGWMGAGDKGIVMLLEPTETFYRQPPGNARRSDRGPS